MGSSIYNLLTKPLGVVEGGGIIGLSRQTISRYNSLRKKTDFTDLENFLNGLYYGTGNIDAGEVAPEIQRKFIKAQQDILAEILGSAAAGEQPKVDTPHLIGGQHSISRGTYTAYLNMLNSLKLNKLQELETLKGKKEEEYEALRTRIVQLADKLNGISVQELRLRKETGKKSKMYASIFEDIQYLENLGIYLTELQYVQGKIGNAEEKLIKLAESVAKGLEDKKIEETLDNLLTSDSKYNKLMGQSIQTQGQDRVSDITLRSTMTITADDFAQRNKEGKITSYDFDGVKVSISAIKGFQQKMDVSFSVPGYENLRVSMKSWNGFSGHDLGNTTLLNAFLRTANIDTTLAFGLQLKYKEEKGKSIIGLHKFGKTIAVMDIAAGLGQSKGFADTLIVQDRKNQCFKIFDMTEVMEEAIKENGKYFQLTGYDEGMASKMNFTMKKQLGGQRWVNAIMGALKAQNISIVSKVQ